MLPSSYHHLLMPEPKTQISWLIFPFAMAISTLDVLLSLPLKCISNLVTSVHQCCHQPSPSHQNCWLRSFQELASLPLSPSLRGGPVPHLHPAQGHLLGGEQGKALFSTSTFSRTDTLSELWHLQDLLEETFGRGSEFSCIFKGSLWPCF